MSAITAITAMSAITRSAARACGWRGGCDARACPPAPQFPMFSSTPSISFAFGMYGDPIGSSRLVPGFCA